MATHYSSHHFPLALTKTSSTALSLCVFWVAAVGGVKDDLVFCLQWCLYQPHAGRPLLLTNKSVSHINYSTSPQLPSDFESCPVCDLCNFEWLSAHCTFSNESWPQRSAALCPTCFYLLLCVFVFFFQSPNKLTVPPNKIRPLTSLDHPQSPFYDPEGGAITPVARVVVERIARKVSLFSSVSSRRK